MKKKFCILNNMKITEKGIRKTVEKIMWKYTFGDFNNGNLPDVTTDDVYPEYVAKKIAERLFKKISKK